MAVTLLAVAAAMAIGTGGSSGAPQLSAPQAGPTRLTEPTTFATEEGHVISSSGAGATSSYYFGGSCQEDTSPDDGCPSSVPSATSPESGSYEGWGNMTPYLSGSPPARSEAAMAFDGNSSADYVVLFGGEGVRGALGDTWIYRAGVWTNVTPNPINSTNSPAARFGASMAYDAADGYLVLFGGSTGPITGTSNPLLNDTWAFDNGNWRELCSACGPTPRAGATAGGGVTDSGVLLFGGLGDSGGTPTLLGDTWSFVGGAWSPAAPATSPSARYDASLSFDPTSGDYVLFGGCVSALATALLSCSQVADDTWEFSGGDWSEFAAGSSAIPAGRWAAGFETGAAPNGPVLFGGATSAGSLSDTWEEESGVWTNLTSGLLQSPSPRSGFGMAWDNASGDDYFVIFGGSNGTLLNQTWVYPSPFDPLRVTAPTANDTVLDAGSQLALNVTVSGGAGKNNYTWFGLPSGCFSADSNKIACRPGTPSGAPSSSIIVVRVADKVGSIVWSPEVTIVVNPIPTVAISGAPTNVGLGPLTVTLTATTLWGTPPFAFAWLLGDGTNATGPVVVHTYTAVRSYAVTVWANDSSGHSIDAHYAIRVVAPFASLLQIQPANTSFSLGTAVIFEAFAAGGETPYSYSWSGLPPSCVAQNSPEISCTLNDAGSFAVSVNVTDFFGNYSVAFLNVTVAAPWFDSPYIWVGTAVLAGVVVGLVAVVWIRRRRRGSQGQPSPMPAGQDRGAPPPASP